MVTVRRPEGTQDILPDQAPAWARLEELIRGCFLRYGYAEVRPPIFEHTRLFQKSTGDTSDIVEKEMFTVPSRSPGDDSYTFRPEITPGAIRLLVENNLFEKRKFWKVSYIGPAFRYERPQKGRLRQFVQFGVEAVGSKEPLLDVEVIAVYADILRAAGVGSWDLRINTLGCANCRGAYRDLVRAAVTPNLARYCDNCRRRFERNVFRIFDCKVETCSPLAAALPAVADHVCAECKDHFGKVRGGLADAKLEFSVDKRIVRGLDYYTRTVWEYSSPALGAQNALGGGGRYDSLVAGMGGPDVGAVGFAAGLERLLLAAGRAEPVPPACDFFAVSVSEEARAAVFRIVQELRAAGLSGDLDFEARSVKAQMRRANEAGARFGVIVGPDELSKGLVKVKDMTDGSEAAVPLPEAIQKIGRKA